MLLGEVNFAEQDLEISADDKSSVTSGCSH